MFAIGTWWEFRFWKIFFLKTFFVSLWWFSDFCRLGYVPQSQEGWEAVKASVKTTDLFNSTDQRVLLEFFRNFGVALFGEKQTMQYHLTGLRVSSWKTRDAWWQIIFFLLIKFRYSEKATKIWKISLLFWTYLSTSNKLGCFLLFLWPS